MSAEVSPPSNGSSPSRCSSTTRGGTQCKAWAMTGSTLCRAHGMTEEERLAFAATGRAARSGQKEAREDAREAQRMGLRAMLGARMEERADAITARMEALALSADDATSIQGLKLWLERVHGRAIQPTRDETPSNPLAEALASLSPEERRALFAVAREQPDLPEPASTQG